MRTYDWSDHLAIVDCFPAKLETKDIVSMLISVGFSSPPDWVKPYRVLSTGQQMRADLARGLCECLVGERDLVCFDEFTSTVDRVVAQIGSAALAKAIRKRPGQKFIAITCHEDVCDWLTPDWVYEPATNSFDRRSLRPGWDKRPPIEIAIARCHTSTWAAFRQHHYLSAQLNIHALCYLSTWRGVPVGFFAVLPQVGFKDAFRGSRNVVLPDFQGVGIGQAVADRIAEEFRRQGKRFRTTISHPAVLAHKAHSPRWKLVTVKPAGFARNNTGQAKQIKTASMGRSVATYEYVGEPVQSTQEQEPCQDEDQEPAHDR